MVCVTWCARWKSCWISMIKTELLISTHYFLLSIFKSPLRHRLASLKLIFMHMVVDSWRCSKGTLISFWWKLPHSDVLVKANCFVFISCWRKVSVCQWFICLFWVALSPCLCLSLQRYCTSSCSSAMWARWCNLSRQHCWLLSYRMAESFSRNTVFR